LTAQLGLFAGPELDRRRSASTQDVKAARHSPLLEAPGLPPGLRLGTSSWFFPGWRGLVYEGQHSQSALSRAGLGAYAQCPLLRTVSLDRTFYAPLSAADYQRYARQVPDDFSFVVKAPALVTDAVARDEQGRGEVGNPRFLDAAVAAREFVLPCIEGLGPKAGPMVFQISPLPRRLLDDRATLVDRLEAFFAGLPRQLGCHRPLYALELRDPELVSPRVMRMLAHAGVRYCIGLHARMPPIDRQRKALELLDAGRPGPLVVRWNLHRGFLYEAARRRYAPFDKLIDEDVETRTVLARMAADACAAGQPVWTTANNKAEGSAPMTLLELARQVARTVG
jgi:uncharacterized protein YecE (DUF72 family)